MKILHVITSLYTGGAEKLVVDLVPRLLAMGHEVGVAVFNAETTPLMKRLECECPECRIYKLGKSFYNPLYIYLLIPIMCRYDVIHTHNSSPQLYAAIANVFCRKKLITTEHNTSNRKRSNRLLAVIDKWMYGRYHQIICISCQAEQNLRDYLSSRQQVLIRICTIYNGVDVEAIHKASPLEKSDPQKFLVVMVAAYRPQKDHVTLIRAMKRLPTEKFEAWLVGDGECQQDIEQFIRQQGMDTQVKMLGMRTDVPRILKTADVIVMSTHYEGMSLSNIEGMAAGKPFVASNVEGIREVTEGFGVLFSHGNDASLAEILQRLHDDNKFYLQVAARCYERAKQFDIMKMVDGYNNVYLKLLSNEA